MALLAFDGFDNYAAGGADLTARSFGQLNWITNANVGSPGRALVGSYTAMGNGSTLRGTFTTPQTSAFVGFAMRIPSPTATSATIALLDQHSSGAVQLSFAPDPNRAALNIFRGGSTLIGTTANNTLNLATWNYIEIFATIDATAGVVIIRNNGQQIVNLTGLNTKATGNAWFDGISFSSGGQFSEMDIDDFYLADTTTGPGIFPFNTFAGDVRSIELNTVAPGASTQWTPLTSTNWFEVSQVHNDGDSSYNASSTPGQTDLFTFAALSGTISTVLAVQLTGSYRKDDAAVHEITQQLVSGATTTNGITNFVPGGYVYFTDLFQVDPNTGAQWTVAGVNALQAGYTLTS